MYNTGIEIPKISFTSLDYTEIESGSYFIGFDLDNAGKLSKIDNTGTITVIERADGLTDLQVNITHAELVSAKNSANLIPGLKYRITDFQTIYDQPDYDENQNPRLSGVLKIAEIDPIIVTAMNQSELELEAYQENYPNDTIKYILEFTTPISNTNTKGRIIERIDEWQNRTDFDHRTVLLKRYLNPVGNIWNTYYSSYWDTSLSYPEREYDILTNTPVLANGVSSTYEKYICTTAGTRDFGSGDITVNIGDWLMINPMNGTEWVKINGSIESHIFNMDNPNPAKPTNNYIQGIYSAFISHLDDISDIPFDISNIVFNDFGTYDNRFLGTSTNATFYGETYQNEIQAIMLNVSIGASENGSGNCIGNRINYRFKNINITGYFNANQLSQISNVNLIGGFSGNIGVYVYDIIGRGEIRYNKFSEFSRVHGEFDYYEFRIDYNNFGRCDNIIFNNISQIQAINGCIITSLFTSCNFHEHGMLYNCNFTQFSGNQVHGGIYNSKGITVTSNIFYGTVQASDFGPSFSSCEVGPGYGVELIGKQFVTGYDNELPRETYSNINKGPVYGSTFGACVTGNTFECLVDDCIIPSFFQNNYVRNLSKDQFNHQKDFTGIPELVSPTTTEITTRRIKLTQQIIDDNTYSFLDNILFQDVDENGDNRYWFTYLTFSINSYPFMENSSILAGAAGTGIGDGYSNSLKIAKADEYSRVGAVSQLYNIIQSASNYCVPSLDELVTMYNLGIFPIDVYWSSSEIDSTTAYAVDFADGSILTLPKTESHLILPISYNSSFDTVIFKYTDEYGSEIVKSLV